MDLIGEKMLCFKGNIKVNEMAALDGKITIESGLRPCIVKRLYKQLLSDENRRPLKYGLVQYEVKEESLKTLFHFWHPVTGNAVIEYEDGTIHEVEPTQIRFVDNAMSEYAFPEMEENING